jgi:hypothetical protein
MMQWAVGGTRPYIINLDDATSMKQSQFLSRIVLFYFKNRRSQRMIN